MKIQKILLSIAVILYLCFAFVINEINPFEWEREERLFFVVLCFMCFIFSMPYIYNPFNKEIEE